MKYKVTIYKLNSRKREQIVDCQIFDNRYDAEEFLAKQKSETKPYKINDKKSYHILEAL